MIYDTLNLILRNQTDRSASDALWDVHEYFIRPMNLSDKILFITIIVVVVLLLLYLAYRGVIEIWK